MKIIPSKDLKLFQFGQRDKLIFILCAAILWILAIVAFLTPNFNHWVLVNCNFIRSNYMLANLCYYFTNYTLSFIATPISLLYLASFKFNKLKPYRIVFLLSVMTLAIGIPIVDFMKYYGAVPRPWLLYPDINSIYHPGGHSFPSGHAFQAFAGTLPLIICFLTNDATFKRNLKKTVLAVILMIFAISLSLSRLIAGVHFPTDVLFGIGLAVIMMVILISALQYLLKTGELNLQNEKWYALIFLALITIDMCFL
ncbi:MAG: phosphatase PAP2 family protein [Methanobacterium sp. ERen5]|nr:MAG: phosphatase PAP2 family protein [Methanobacterium sp. ERen5]